uniref:Ribosomal protein L19 n=1 Tax=Pseudocodium devriesii TaxID=453070 RepID=A0A386B136_9CHLO|nr:ribosomal protein L19 [Pseudocodium devriesii]AYC65405.1 ribosomal protein L19 [Pseudocodium devriesii]
MEHFETTRVEKQNRSQKFQQFSVGDYIKIGFLFKEGEKKRLQFFEGIVIAFCNKKITLRRVGAQAQFGVERVFSLTSPQIQTLKILQSQNFGRSKLFYLRKRVGKAAFGLQ